MAMELPADMTQALQNDPVAQATFAKLPPSHQREYLNWIEEAKKAETRQKRISKTLEMFKITKKS